MNGLNYIESKGEVSFFSDKNGDLWQERGGNYFIVENKLIYLATKKSYIIKFNANGTCGYSIFKGGKLIQDDIWTLSEADQIIINLK